MANCGHSGTRAPSVAFHYDDKQPGDIILQDIFVPLEGLTKCTYYCCLQWNVGQNGGGYCGIQDHPDGRNFIFSIWDPLTSKDPIEASHIGVGTKIERFGGEGTGLKSWNFERGWEPDRWYTLVARRWDSSERSHHTSFGFWVKDHTNDEWIHLVTMEFPVENVFFNTGTCCFLEDWHGTGENPRQVRFRNGFKRSINGKWLRFQKAIFNVVQEEACRLYNENYDGGSTADRCIYLQCGSSTLPNPALKRARTVDNAPSSLQPAHPSIEFTVLLNAGEILWAVSNSCAPQLKCTIIHEGEILFSKASPGTRTFHLDASKLGNIEIILEDILGKRVSKTVKCS